MIKLPKQWRHWVKLAGLKPERIRGRGNLLYLVGNGRRWRVDMYGVLNKGETLDTFDRWANSTEDNFPLPKTRDEFLRIVKGRA